jgi:ABC-type nitrate/sulfonate/bicarbonate transport system permease component
MTMIASNTDQRTGLGKRQILLPLLFGIAFLIGWEALYQSGTVSKLILAGPSAVIAAAIQNWREMAVNAGVTMVEALAGFALGNLAGLLVALAFVRWQPFKRAVFPLAILCEAIPVVAILPVLILWLGNGMGPKIFIAGFLSFFPMLVNAYRGLINTDADMMELLHSYSASPRQIMWTVRLPSALPFMFTAIKLSACGSMVAALVAEWLASEAGLGHLIVYYGLGYRIPNVWAAAILACLISLAFYALAALAEKWVLRRRLR